MFSTFQKCELVILCTSPQINSIYVFKTPLEFYFGLAEGRVTKTLPSFKCPHGQHRFNGTATSYAKFAQ